VARPQQTLLHQEQELGAAGVRHRVLAEAREQGARRVEAVRAVQLEGAEHAQAPKVESQAKNAVP
jgi:hypothetical protein